MKKLSAYILALLVLLIGSAVRAQSAEEWTGKKAEQWYTKMEWLNGLPAKPGEGINKEEFAKRYHNNPAAWDKAFLFLKNTDFTRLRPGKYPIDDENVFATISEGPPREINSSKWEAHQTYTDIHFVVKGKEKIGITPVEKVNGNVAVGYDSAKDIGFYSTDDGPFYVAEPGIFYIVTPTEAHNPSNKVEGYDGVKKVVVKVRTTPTP
ncbi:YhcH/YjgK/YiaL family protein [Spirosoma sp. BT702]|uniref:YhcH/YjgK/YiaL family protein n=1 Tax=Spirosoma profusum TaxID=2771354 RepID=A0A926XT90_9BACT|nr:YhcH/YjgK/YiaL family protein [Spirosoma profusum]MBD2699814.1 YhcH/YjgK/YiaL family protein [Spirosoma profusum]